MKLFQAINLLIILSFTASITAVTRYAKPGCNDTCGNVKIPYPFGIGAGCSVNRWYNVVCNSSKPYLSELKYLEVLGVNMELQTVTVNTPKISDCQNPDQNTSQAMSIDLGSSPFLFSKSHNKFVFEGCGNAVMMDQSRVLTGCSTNCLSEILDDGNNCFGISCCHTAIPYSLQSYNIQITEQSGDDGACGSAFLVDQNSYVSGDNSSYVPVSLLWTMSQDDIDQEFGNFTPAIKREFASYVVNGEQRVIPRYAKPNCIDTCGNMRIPYPFGIGADCSVNQWYIIECNSSTPYLSALNHLQVLDISSANQTITVNAPKISTCQNPSQNNRQTMSINLDTTPFFFSKSHNKFVFEGCGNVLMMNDRNHVLTGCSANCQNDSIRGINNCYGVGCCQTTIPHYLKLYNINITDDRACGSAFLVGENSYVERDNDSFVPVSLLWTLSPSDINQVSCYYSPDTLEIDLGNGTTFKSWKCAFFELYSYYMPPQGNPYVDDGLLDTEDCARCKANGSYCLYDRIHYYDADYSFKLKFSCMDGHSVGLNTAKIPNISIAPEAPTIAPYNDYVPDNDNIIKSRDTSLGLILGISLSMGVTFLVATSFLLYKVIKKTNEKRRRKRFFKRNGGLLLKQQEVDPSIVDKTKLFTSHELEMATDNFNETKIIGKGGQGTVYKGMLTDGRNVAVKKSQIVDESQLEPFINEVVILSQVNHRNVVKLLGCCLETDVPMLVSKFIPNGTLYDHLHNKIDDSPISLKLRLQIATEVAGALAYLHSATSLQIYHRDIKTTNILLDDEYRAKVSDFGTSRFVAIDKSHLTTLVKGTFGYLDPEYFQSSQFTEKSDVYSFGVVLVELLTGEKPISLDRSDEHRSLATYFMFAMEEGCVMSIFEAVVVEEGTIDELLAVANLAQRCLNPIGKHRPTMKEVATELETIRISHVASMDETSIDDILEVQ